jgi:hypothetical protein
MKKTIYSGLIALCFIVIGVILSRPAAAQIIPDTIFDNPPQAFGNTIQDVTPDILAVDIVPAAPSAGEEVRVSANIRVNPEISKFKVKEAYVYYRKAGQQTNLKRVSMSKSDRSDWWTAALPGFPEGAQIEYYVRGVDEIENEVVQLPVTDAPKPADMIEVSVDGRDDGGGLPGAMDILSVLLAYNGKELIACPKTRVPFQQYSTFGADAIAVGYVADDVRYHPSRSITENTAGFVGYMPSFNIQGILRLEDLERGSSAKRDDSSAKMSGRYVCMRANVSSLTSTPERGLKIFAATLAINPLNKEVSLGDATPYATVYFKGGSFTVAPKLP